MSVLVITRMIAGTPSASSTTAWSWVCCIQPSSAATSSSAQSRLHAPATMFRMNRSCPGTSITPIGSPPAPGNQAKPRSIVMPRSFSSGRRSGSMPVSASINVDLPWSTWPEVPMTRISGSSPR